MGEKQYAQVQTNRQGQLGALKRTEKDRSEELVDLWRMFKDVQCL